MIYNFIKGYILGYAITALLDSIRSSKESEHIRQQQNQPDIYVESRIVMPEDDD